jgi:unsaturated chondroitin disaccharide hydrolase
MRVILSYVGLASVAALAALPKVVNNAGTCANGDCAIDAVIAAAQSMANATIASTKSTTAYPTNGDPKSGAGWVTSGYSGWTSGFWPGLLWKLFNYTTVVSPDTSSTWWGDNAAAWTSGIAPEQFDTGTHDVGFMVYTSFGPQWHLTQNATARAICLRTATSLASRFVPSVGAIRSWGQPNAQHTCEVIADNMMNLELLWWAAKESGNTTFSDIANSHSKTMIKDLYQPFNPGCAWHLITYNDTDGSIISRSSTPQGLGVNTVWSRGQSWTVNGFMIAFRFTQDAAYLAQAQAAADCFIRLTTATTADSFHWMPLWDFNVTASQANIDTSAGMIAASGMIELSWALPLTEGAQYAAYAYRLLESARNYWSYDGSNDALLRNGTVTYPLSGIPIIYADYYYVQGWMQWDATPQALKEAALALLGA